MPSQLGFLAYELNPPKLITTGLVDRIELETGLQAFYDRARKLLEYVDIVHLTDSVLGGPRLSSIGAAIRLRHRFGSQVRLRCNVRTCDHNLNSIIQLVGEAEVADVEGVLILRGDEPKYGEPFNNGASASILRELRELGFTRNRIKFFLTTPLQFDREQLDAKLQAEPDGFITQPIGDLDVLNQFIDHLKPHGVELVAFVLVPSAKNLASAATLGFNWAKIEGDVATFVDAVRRRVDGVLISSPNSFGDGLSLISALGK